MSFASHVRCELKGAAWGAKGFEEFVFELGMLRKI
jgi:hypothetical protein